MGARWGLVLFPSPSFNCPVPFPAKSGSLRLCHHAACRHACSKRQGNDTEASMTQDPPPHTHFLLHTRPSHLQTNRACGQACYRVFACDGLITHRPDVRSSDGDPTCEKKKGPQTLRPCHVGALCAYRRRCRDTRYQTATTRPDDTLYG